MSGIKTKFFFYSTAILFFLMPPLFSEAAYVYPVAEKNNVMVEDKFLVTLRLNTEGKTINTLEGLIGVYSPTGPVYIHELSVAGSDFSLWPSKPSLASGKDSSSISFTGGVPNGINSQNALLFTIALTAENPGELYVAPVSLTGYLNDGKGSPLFVNGNELKMYISKADRPPEDQWQHVIENDTEPPLPFSIAMGQDSSVFNNKKFISFFTTDTASGIDRYEVIEGDRNPVRSGTTYVLQDQGIEQTLTVIAYDKAGNSQSATYNPTSQNTGIFGMILVIVLSIIIIILLILAIRKWIIKK